MFLYISTLHFLFLFEIVVHHYDNAIAAVLYNIFSMLESPLEVNFGRS